MHGSDNTETIDIRLYGSLSRSSGQLESKLALSEPTTLDSVIRQLGISRQLVRLAMVNHRAASCDAPIRSGDSIALFPAEYPFFADWKDFWPSHKDESRDRPQ